MEKELKHLRDWSKAKIDEGSEPPWAWYQHMKLIETIDVLLAGMQTVPEAGLLHLTLVDEDTNAPVGTPVNLPM